MAKRMLLLALAAGFLPVAEAGSLTLGALVDSDDGSAFDLTGRISPTDAWTLGAGFGHSQSELDGDKLSGDTWRLSTDFDLGAFFIGASAERWKDAGQLRSTALKGELGWMSAGGVALSALVANRAMRVTYTGTLLGELRQRDIEYEGTGFGADLSFLGEHWTASARFLDYDYGQSVERVRQVLESADTTRFPRLQQLIGSVATRAASAPDQELSFALGYKWSRTSVTADLQWQRDALTADKTRSAGLTVGFDLTPRVLLDTSAGVTDGGDAGTVPWAGIALTLRGAK